jgi:hypothetical protein
MHATPVLYTVCIVTLQQSLKGWAGLHENCDALMEIAIIPTLAVRPSAAGDLNNHC